MKKLVKSLFFVFIILSFLYSCVPARKYEDLNAKRQQCEKENSDLKAENQQLKVAKTELESKVENLEHKMTRLVDDTTALGRDIRRLTSTYEQLNSTYNMLLEKNKEYLAGNRSDMEKLLKDLNEREKELGDMEKELNAKKTSLDELSEKLKQSQEEMKDKEMRLNELQSILSRKDSIVNALKNKVSDALQGFENKGLTIYKKNGKVYVSLEESLLFASGKYNVNQKGVDALKKLAKVLETNTDINVLIEGHTDNVPYNGSGDLKDNWDLSVMRATAVVKILIQNSKIDPQRLSASGRSEYQPVDKANTAEAKAKNRRTEIILTPKLDELFKIIESN